MIIGGRNLASQLRKIEPWTAVKYQDIIINNRRYRLNSNRIFVHQPGLCVEYFINFIHKATQVFIISNFFLQPAQVGLVVHRKINFLQFIIGIN